MPKKAINSPATIDQANTGLKSTKLLRLSMSLLWREVRAGQMSVIILALILAVTAASVISVFSNRLDSGMLNKTTELLGADVRVRSNQIIPDTFYQQAKSFGLKTTTTLEFPSVVIFGEEMSLAAVKAVDAGYPLKGTVSVSQHAFGAGTKVIAGPNTGEVWLESRLLALLNAQIGDQIEVGRSTFIISGLITQESDRGGNFYSLSPRLMMNLDDIKAAGLVQLGSRVTWRLLAAVNLTDVDNSAIINNFKQWLEPKIEAHQNIESLSDNNLALAGSLDKARSYLSLAAILAILLSGIAIAMAARDYAQHHFDTSALLRTLGASRSQVLKLFLIQLCLLALVTSIIGLILGTLIQSFLVDILSALFVNELPAASWHAWAMACATAPFILIGFALPHLLRLGRVSPLRILRRELEPMSWNAWAVYCLAISSVFVLSYWFTQNLKMSALLVLGGFLILSLLMLALRFLLGLLAKVIPQQRFNVYFRFAWQHMVRDTQSTATQILAFSIILMVMVVINTVRSDLLADWQQSLPEGAPNFFAMNIQSYEVEPYQQALESAGFKRKPLFPMIAGRLTEINGSRVQDNDEINQDPALQRDLALTWSDALPEGNKVLQGNWLSTTTQQVSVEARIASRLNIQLDDTLTFEVAGERFQVGVSSIRFVDWGTLSPNFYMIFSKDVLESLPAAYLTSFHVDKEQHKQLTQLIRQFPTITLLDMSMVFVQIQKLLEQVSMAVEYLLILVLLSGLLVLMATLHSSLDERLQQGAVLRTLGASRLQLRLSQWCEFALLGFVAGVIAIMGAEAICYVLYNKLFDLEYQVQWILWLVLPIISAVFIMLLASITTRKVTRQSPVSVLREV